jgi:hypothetical protein
MSMSEDKDKKREFNLQIQIDDDTAQGIYINFTMINHSETEFTADMIYIQPQQPKAKVRARLIFSPKHALRLLRALKENVELYEKKFGPIFPKKIGSNDDEVLH